MFFELLLTLVCLMQNCTLEIAKLNPVIHEIIVLNIDCNNFFVIYLLEIEIVDHIDRIASQTWVFHIHNSKIKTNVKQFWHVCAKLP